MDRRHFLLASLAGALATPLSAGAQQAEKMWKIGFLGAATAARFERFIEAVRLGLRDYGYVENKNITIEFRWAEGRYDRLPDLAMELVRLDADAIITHGTPGTLALKRATSTIPIVMAIIGNPVENGAVASLARPGGNITGSSFFSDEVTAKRLDILKAAFPALVRVGVLTNPQNVAGLSGRRAMESMAQALNVQVQFVGVRHPHELDSALAVAKAQGDGVVLTDEQVVSVGDSPGRIADFALRNRLPSAGPVDYPQAGGLIGYGVDVLHIVRHSMVFVDRIFKGTKPADLPVEQASKFLVVINLKTAKALGLTIPPSLLARADQLIE